MSSARLPRVLRTTGFGLGLLYVTLLAFTVIVLGAIVYLTVRASFESERDEQIGSEVNLLEHEYAAEGFPELVREISARSHYYPSLDYLLTDSSGRVLNGTLPVTPKQTGWSYLENPPDPRTGRPEQHFKVLSVALDGGLRLSVGDPFNALRSIQQAFIRALAMALVAFCALSIAGAYLVSRGFLKRVDAISGTAEAIIRGELTSRIPVRETEDPFDRLCTCLNRMLDRIQALMDSLSQISNDIAHAMRTPLGRLRQKLEAARLELGRNEKAALAMDAAIVEADQLLQTFSALLRIAQIEAGTRKSGFREIDLSSVFERAVEAFAPVAEDEGKQLSSKIEPGLRSTGDPELLMEMLANLLENAIRHTPAATQIEVSLAARDDHFHAVVADTGPGVPAGERDSIFNRFYRLGRSRSTDGTGLGLSLVAAVAELHSAHIVADDGSPGLVIRISFPRKPDGEMRFVT